MSMGGLCLFSRLTVGCGHDDMVGRGQGSSGARPRSGRRALMPTHISATMSGRRWGVPVLVGVCCLLAGGVVASGVAVIRY